jgi:hypothetical protein
VPSIPVPELTGEMMAAEFPSGLAHQENFEAIAERCDEPLGFAGIVDVSVETRPLPKTGLVTQAEDVLFDARDNVFVSDKNQGINILRLKC